MARFALLLTICAALLSACSTYSTPASRPAQPNGKPVFITLQVEQHLNKYYRTIGGGRSGAFAVSDKGTVGFYAYCQAVTCRDEVSFTRHGSAPRRVLICGSLYLAGTVLAENG